MSTNERTNIRTIVKWSKPAVLFTVALVLLAAYVFVQKAYAQPLDQVSHSLHQSQQEAIKIKTNLQQAESQKEQLETEVQNKEHKI